MTRRVCLEPGCPTITDAPRCPVHTRARDKARGTRQARGYDAAHDAERSKWQRIIDAGENVPCARCGQHIAGPWHLDHNNERTGYLGPSCADCNLRAAGKVRHQ